jgi:hypothetical protein
MMTRNGQEIRFTGANDTPEWFNQRGEPCAKNAHKVFVKVQIMPPVPQRFELVRRTNLRGDDGSRMTINNDE